MRKIHLLIFALIFAVCSQNSIAQKTKEIKILTGPMNGYSEMKEAMIWVQTDSEAEVFAVYSNTNSPEVKRRTNVGLTNKQTAFTARLIADTVEPGQRYYYEIFVNNTKAVIAYETSFKTPPIWRWRSDPPDFTLITGSCAYINQAEYDRSGKPYGGDYHIFSNMAKHNADLMLWLGDNIYLREPDWNSWTGIVNRYVHSRSVPELQPLLSSTQNYAIWDDHDYGPNDSNKSFVNKQLTLEAFRLFWGNPGYGTDVLTGAIASFQWGDADFFLLDNRTYRDPDELNKEKKTMLGGKQLEWLFDNLVSSKATFKIIALGGQFLSDADVKSELYTAFGFKAERDSIIKFIYANNIRNVIFLTGDVHFTEMSVLQKEGQPTIYDCTFSALTSSPNTSGEKWGNSFRIPETVVMQRNFGKLTFSGKANERCVTISSYNSNNEKLWERKIYQE